MEVVGLNFLLQLLVLLICLLSGEYSNMQPASQGAWVEPLDKSSARPLNPGSSRIEVREDLELSNGNKMSFPLPLLLV